MRRLDESTPWEWFPSAGAAEKATGTHNLHHVANKDKPDDKGWIAKWADPPETQEDLPGEEWVEAVGSNGRAKVSNCGRAWRMYTGSKTEWGYKFRPQINDGRDYATIRINGVLEQFHRVVFFSFGHTLEEGETVDHKDQKPANNRLDNLRPATGTLQMLNRTLLPSTDTHNSLKHAVYARPVDAPADASWEWFQSFNEAGRQLSARHPGKKFDPGNIGQVCNGLRKQHAGYHFCRA